MVKYARPDDMILRSYSSFGPAALVRSKALKEEHLTLAAGLAQFYSRWREEAPISVRCWKSAEPAKTREILAVVPDEDKINAMLRV
jgi:predicted ribosome quality control (RQC) complex YloA/Tae2 family protein